MFLLELRPLENRYFSEGDCDDDLYHHNHDAVQKQSRYRRHHRHPSPPPHHHPRTDGFFTSHQSHQVDQYFVQAYQVSLKRCTKDVSNTAGTRMGMHCPGRVFRGWC